MRLYKRGPYWWCSFTWSGTTVRRSTKCAARGSALLVAQRWERERADPDHAVASTATFGGAVKVFLEHLERTDKPAPTRTFYRQKCGTLVRLLGAELPLSAITAGRIDRYLAERGKEGTAFDDKGKPVRFVTPNTMHKELVALRQILKRARRRGEFRKDPSEIMPVGFSPKYVPRNVTLSSQQLLGLLGALTPRRGAVVAYMAATGARRSEAFAQRTADIEWDTGVVRLRGTKTSGSDRTVVVPPFLRPLLDYAAGHGGGKGGLLLQPWPDVVGGLRRACKRAGCPRVTPNDLRRTLSTWLLEGDVSLYAVSKVLGHASTAVLEKVYGKPRDTAIGDIVAKATAGLTAVPLVYQGASVRDLPGPTQTNSDHHIPEEIVGHDRLELSANGLRVQFGFRCDPDNQARSSSCAPSTVPVVYVSQRVNPLWSPRAAAMVEGLLGVRR